MKYVTIGADDLSNLDEMVNAAIADGWVPLGGVSVAGVFQTWEGRKGTETETNWTYIQAMTHGVTG